MESLEHLLERTAAPPTGDAVETVLLCLLLAFVLGQVIAWAYSATHVGLSYSRTFTQSLVLLTMIVSLVMLVIGNNIVTAFGLLGALAIIRFRNVLKDTRDTAFIFLGLVVGMAIGAQKFLTAIVGTVSILSAALYLYYTAFGTQGRYDGLSVALRRGWERRIGSSRSPASASEPRNHSRDGAACRQPSSQREPALSSNRVSSRM